MRRLVYSLALVPIGILGWSWYQSDAQTVQVQQIQQAASGALQTGSRILHQAAKAVSPPVTVSAAAPAVALPPAPPAYCPSGPALSFQSIYQRLQHAYVVIRATVPHQNGWGGYTYGFAYGSGVYVGPDLVLTAAHVATAGGALLLAFPQGMESTTVGNALFASRGLVARTVWTDPQQDLALLHIDVRRGWVPTIPSWATPLPLGHDSCLQSGQTIYGIGTALGHRGTEITGFGSYQWAQKIPGPRPVNSSMPVVGGITRINAPFTENGQPDVSATGIQFSGDMTPGFSGGPVVNVYGQLIGVYAAESAEHLPGGPYGWRATTGYVSQAKYAKGFLRGQGVPVS